jgi:two-component system, NtrC family, sensor kinase
MKEKQQSVVDLENAKRRIDELSRELEAVKEVSKIREDLLLTRIKEEEEIFQQLKQTVEAERNKSIELERSQQASLNIMEDLQMAKMDLEGSKVYIKNILASLSDTIIVINLDGTIRTVNQAALDLLGYTKKEFIGKKVEMIFEEGESFRKTIFPELSNKGSIYNYETNCKPKDGSVIPVLFSGTEMRDPKGNAEGIVGIAKDISELKEMEKHLIQAEKVASLGQYVAGAAHELNNPLAGIMGFSEIILHDLKHRKVNNDRLKLDVEKILNGTKRCKNIVSDLLMYRKDSEPVFAATDINQLIDKSIPFGKYKKGVMDIKIVKKYSINIPKIIADETLMLRVFTNIINNAYKSMEGKGLLKIITEKKGDYIDIVFQDTGNGIRKENISKLFDPFFTMREVGDGTGLGLSVCAGIITKTHNGKILVESDGEGKGARFIIKLPIERRHSNVKKK